MQHRDLFQQQIEQLGRVLGQLIAQVLGTAHPSGLQEATEEVQSTLQQEFNFDLAKFILLNDEELESYLSERNIPVESYDDLARLLGEIGLRLETNHKDKGHFLTKAVALLDLAEKKTQTVSFERIGLRHRFNQD